MIHVVARPEPVHFNDAVRKPGLKYLAATPQPTADEWKSHAYWSRVKDDLYDAYDHVCAYSCFWIPPTGSRTCDHFKPKDWKPKLAYEWKNFRLMNGILNGRKTNHRHLLDPFKIQDGWFVLDFPSLLVHPASNLPSKTSAKVQTTIDVLKLNDDGTCRRERTDWLRAYCIGPMDFAFLQTMAPFLALELQRQNLASTITSIMRF